jgi:hypothetical protein
VESALTPHRGAFFFSRQDGGDGHHGGGFEHFGDDDGVHAGAGLELFAGIGSASTQTCTVVLAGSVAGLTTVTLPGTSCPLSV